VGGNIALEASTGSITYRELDQWSDSIAAELQRRGVGDGMFRTLVHRAQQLIRSGGAGGSEGRAAYVPLTQVGLSYAGIPIIQQLQPTVCLVAGRTLSIEIGRLEAYAIGSANRRSDGPRNTASCKLTR